MRLFYFSFLLPALIGFMACGGLQQEPLDDVTAANTSYQKQLRVDSNGLGKKNQGPEPKDSSQVEISSIEQNPDSTALTKAEADSIRERTADQRLVEYCYKNYGAEFAPSIAGMTAFAKKLAYYKSEPHLFPTGEAYKYVFYARGQNQPQSLWLARYDTANIALHLLNAKMQSFRELQKKSERQYHMMMNAGMFHEDGSPVGLFIENGKEYEKLNLKKGPGNFYLKPNGVFFITQKGHYGVMETEAFRDSLYSRPKQAFQLATQSGPMLLVDGKIHPIFTEGSSNLNIRNGVGVVGNEVIFALSDQPINLYDFATAFKLLGCENALYLDGVISDMKIEGAKRPWSYTRRFGPVLGLEKQP